MNKNQLDDLQNKLGHTFKDPALLTMALTHSSTADHFSYERLEFLGDRVLGLIVAEMLYKRFPEESEGDLAKRLAALVQGSLLAEIATKIELGQYIRFSEAEAAAGGAENAHILADVFESLLGALYLDSDLKICEAFIHSLWDEDFFHVKKPPQHPKTTLQEWAQGQGLPLPIYEIASQDGPDHAPVFEIRLSVPGYEPVLAKGNARGAAEKAAAQAFIEKHIL